MTGQCEQKQSANEGPFLGAVTSGSLTQWNETIQINNKQAQFKLDTGAEVKAISEATHKRIGKPYLDKVSKSLYGPPGTSLVVCDQFLASLSHNLAHTQQPVYVVKGL